MKYKELYIDLAWKLTELGCRVCDHDIEGYCYQVKNFRAFVVIKADMGFKEKYMTLCHEAGHLFTLKGSDTFNWSKKPRSEDKANQFVLRLLKLNDIDENEYHEFYEKAKKKVKKRKKSWFEI